MKQRPYNKKVQLSTQLFFCRAGRLAELKGSAVKKFVAPSNSSSRDAWSMFIFSNGHSGHLWVDVLKTHKNV